MRAPSDWLPHSPMTDPGPLSAWLAGLPPDAASLSRVIQGLIVHDAWLDAYDLDPTAIGPVSRATLPVGERLAALLAQDGRELDRARVPAARAIGTCRDFALMLCACLRTHGTAARVRCGFAAYFTETWEDHWVCEYWNSGENRWCLADAQLDTTIRAALGIAFDPMDVPRDLFLTAGEAWSRCRSGPDDPRRFGQGPVRGQWFMGVNVVRDSLAVNDRVTSAWDSWRGAPLEARTMSADAVSVLDRIARHPEDAAHGSPDWPRPPWTASPGD